MNQNSVPPEIMEKFTELTKQFQVQSEYLKRMRNEYEQIYNIFIAALGSLPNKTICIPPEKQQFLAHEYRIWQEQDPKSKELRIKLMSVYDDVKKKEKD